MGAALSRWLDAARKGKGAETKQPPQAPAQPVLSVLSVLSEGTAHPPKPLKPRPLEAFRYGTACGLGNMPLTWTGGVVSLADWRNLTEWEKHGHDGRHWNGITKQWEHPEGHKR
jgi:hypothetical protein